MALRIPPQPTLPAESGYSDIELAFIEETPELFPSNQNSNWGMHRKVLSNQLEILADDLDTIWRNHFALTADEYLDMWEEMLGLPVEPPTTLTQRRQEVVGRLHKGPFTRTRRRLLVEAFVKATFGEPVSIGQAGISLTASGVALPAQGGSDLSAFYLIQEQVENFYYEVSVSRDLGVDLVGLRRELARITPAHINWRVTEDYFESLGSTSSASGGFAKQFDFVEVAGAISEASGGMVKG